MATPKAHAILAPRLGLHADASPRDNSGTRLPMRNGPALIPSSSQRPIAIPSAGSRLPTNSLNRGKETARIPVVSAGARKPSASRIAQEIEKRKDYKVVDTNKSRSQGQSQKSKANLDISALRSGPVHADLNRTPSLVSGSTSSTSGSPQIPSGIRRPSGLSSVSTSRPTQLSSKRNLTEQAHKMPTRVMQPSPVNGTQMIYDHHSGKEDEHQIIHLDQYVPTSGIFAPDRIVNPTPPYTLMTTPSTNHSPGPFSISSTPSSMSSYNSGQAHSSASRFASRLQGPSPNYLQSTAPQQNTSSKLNTARGSSAVRGSSTSSGSTIRRKDSDKAGVRSPTSSRSNSISSQQPVPQQSTAQPTRRYASQGSYLKSGTDGNLPIFPEFSHLRHAAPLAQHHQQKPSVDSSATTTSDQSISTRPVLKTPFPNLSAIASPDRLMPLQPPANPSPNRSFVSLTSAQDSRPPTRGPTPDASVSQESLSRSKLTSPQASKSTSRFGFFSKKTKNEESPNKLIKAKPGRKGPSAGTGHEGYGKFAGRGRSGSTTSGSAGSVEAERSPSVNSTPGTKESPARKSSIGSKTSAEVDEFVVDKLTPVTLRGNGPSRPGLAAVQSASSDMTAQTFSKGLGASTISSGKLGSLQNGQGRRPVLLPSPMLNGGPSVSPTPTHLLSPDLENSAETTALPQIPAKISRRMSLMRRKTIGNNSAQDSALQQIQTAASTDKLTTITKEVSKTTLTSLKASKKWNFFQRAKSPAQPNMEAMEPQTVPVVLRTMPQRSVAHYAFTAAPKKIDLEDLERIMREAEESTPNVSRQPTPIPPPAADESSAPIETPPYEDSAASAMNTQPQELELERTPSLDAAYEMQRELMTEDGTATELDAPAMRSQNDTPPDHNASSQFEREFELKPKVPRLQQVGRIPKVVSTRPRHRDHERQLSDVSFSRPFAPSHPSPAMRNSFGNVLDLFTSKSPELRKEATLSSLPTPIFTPPTASLAASPGESVQSSRINSSDLEYIRLMGQRLAERGSDSSSCGSFPITAALTSLKIEPTLMTHEEDVWGEYDELIDALSPQEPKTPMTAVSTTSSAGAPFHYDTAFAMPSRAPEMPLPDLPIEEEKLLLQEQAPPHLLSIAQKIRVISSITSNATPTAPQLTTPVSPASIDDFFSHNIEPIASVLDPISGRLSIPSQPRSSTASARHSLPISIHARSSTHSIRPRQSRGSLPPPQRNSTRRDSRQIELAENQHMGFEPMANLRFSALMTSKWLSFGRVLFSPIHLELKDPAEDRILIIDGLGKDWSHYVALTYPTASVYNLGPEPVVPISNRASTMPMQSLPNHKHISHPSLSALFPFPKGFFAAVIFRFPIATSEVAYRTALSESKRVLRPGGYLELSVLDIDMLNMGNRARRAVRQLKMEMQHEDASITLKPLSDMMQTMVGRRGFENLNRCFVAIPVAGCIPSSREDSVAGNSSTIDLNAAASKLSVITDSQSDGNKTSNSLPSFNDLLRSDSKEGEEGITKMVARVARWWYMRCYESIILPNADVSRSIWADSTLRKECEKRGTSLRLMVCYAQKPECTVRRTASL